MWPRPRPEQAEITEPVSLLEVLLKRGISIVHVLAVHYEQEEATSGGNTRHNTLSKGT